MPITRSRRPPQRRRSVPESLAATTPPTVALSGHNGSRATCWPCWASAVCIACQVQPASTVQVISCHVCSRIVLIRRVSTRRSVRPGLIQPSLLPEPSKLTAKPFSPANRSTSAACCASAGAALQHGPATLACSDPTIEAANSCVAAGASEVRVIDRPVFERLKIFGDAGSFKRMWSVGPSLFAAQPWTRKQLVGVRKIVWIEGMADALHRFQIRFGVHVSHGFLLLAAHAMFAGDGAAEIDTYPQDAQGKVHSDSLLAGNRGVVEHDGMQVAVACVEDIGDAQAHGF